MNHKLDTDTACYFYENDFYPLSNFSAFRLHWRGHDFDTSEHAYHWSKFDLDDLSDMSPLVPKLAAKLEAIRSLIKESRSAHEAFKAAESNRASLRADWSEVRVGIMRDILRAKASQHEYVRRKLLQTGERELIEDSWRDGFWGWGEDRQGQNMLGKLWMEIRAELRNTTSDNWEMLKNDGGPEM